VPGTKSFFELFHLPQSYEVDSALLEQRYRQLQRSVHPDKYAGTEELAQRLAVQYSSLLNEARDTLKSPLRRAIYLLGLSHSASNIETASTSDVQFLMQQIEWREALEMCAQADDPLAKLDSLQLEFKCAMADYERDFASAYDGKDFAVAESVVHKMQFIAKLISEAEAMEERLLDN